MIMIINSKSAWPVFLYFIFLHNLIWAQSTDTTTMVLDPVVITGTRYLQQKSKIPASISVISRETIELNNRTNVLPVIASQVPGFFMNNRGLVGFGIGPNSAGNISIRGISGSRNAQVLVLIDGQPQFMGLFGHPITDAYISSDIERVEVVRGAASLLYGSNAMGGAINIITRSPVKTGWNGNARLAYGSYQTGTVTGSLGYKEGKFNAFASVNREKTGGYRKDGRDEFENNTAYLKIGYEINENLSISGNAQVADAVYFHPGTVDAPLDNDKREYLRGRASVTLENAFNGVEGALSIFYNAGDHRFSDGFDSYDLNKGITFYQNFKLIPDNVITVGIDYKNFGGKAINENLPLPARVGFGENHRIHETDFYASIQHTVRQKLFLQGGMRLVNNSQYGTFTVPGAGLSFHPVQNITFKTSVSKAFRSPAVIDLFLFPPANEALQPEEMWNYEIGYIQNFWEQKLSLELTGFLIRGDNMIQIIPFAADLPPQGQNSGRFTNTGVEALLKYQPKSNLNFNLNYSFLNASENILFAPQHLANFQIHYILNRFSILAGLQQVYGLNTSLQSELNKEDYSLLNLGLRMNTFKWLQLFAEANNILDVQYQLQRGYPMPGINFLGGLNFNF